MHTKCRATNGAVRATSGVLALIMMIVVIVAVCLTARPRAQGAYDQVLDVYVRDGYVYYRALKADRAKLDGYLATVATTTIDTAPRDEQLAFWLNAYNAVVLRTIVDRYPIPLRTTQYPPHSIRQIPGAFERLQHKVAGRMVTLDQIEQTVLAAFHDPRAYLALGRGAVGGGRLRSEAFTAARLEAQLKEVADECVSRPECVQLDRASNTLNVSSIFSWREKEFSAAHAGATPAAFADRSPIERAVLAIVEPKLLTTEREALAKNDFKMVYKAFDWSLNDLTGRGGR